jgi:site-specific DNA-methyltransferase (adenine-specific)
MIEQMTQTLMFESPTEVQTGLTVDIAASQAGVSTATIRNWIKADHLKQDRYGCVKSASLQSFLTEIAGQEKLTSRANKSCKDMHDHVELSQSFCEKIEVKSVNVAHLAGEYESSLSESFKNKEGIYYTPPHIVADLFQCDDRDKSAMTFLDPCCGSGNFIIRAIELGFKPENVFGYDTDLVAVELTKKRIFEKTGYKSKNIIHDDFLMASLKSKDRKFDFIYTNPPWGKKITKEEKENYSLLFRAGKSTDTSSLFFFACLNHLNENGKLGFLLPDSFFNIAAFEHARKKILSLSLMRLVDYEKPFKGLMTKAFAFTLKKASPNTESHMIDCESNQKRYRRSSRSFLKNPKAIINFQSDDCFQQVLEHALTFPHTTLAGKAQWGLGIVTGNNDKFVKSVAQEGYIPVYRGSDIKNNKMMAPTCFIPKNLSLYQQVAPVEFYEAKEKLIYKFISSKLCFFYDSEKRYILNSANFLIPHHNFPISSIQLAAMLNSDLINWLFANIFQTHKVLKSDLEALPIYVDYFLKNAIFEESSFLQYLSLEKSDNGTYRIKK